METSRVVEICAGALGQPARCDALFERVFLPGVNEPDGCATILSALRAQPGNDKCADCHAPRPDYASVNIGVFLCSWCFGVHRDMGTHVSRTKSIRLDTWRKEWLVPLVRVGNARAAAVWEGDAAAADATRPPSESATNEGSLQVRKPFIQAKYVKQRFLRAPPARHAAASAPGAGGSATAAAAAAVRPVAAAQAKAPPDAPGASRHQQQQHGFAAAATAAPSDVFAAFGAPRASEGLSVRAPAAAAPAPAAAAARPLIDAGAHAKSWMSQFDPLA